MPTYEAPKAALLLAAAALLSPAIARAADVDEREAAAEEKPAIPQNQSAVLTLYLNEVKHADIIVVLRGSDVLVSEDDLRAAGLHDWHGKTDHVHGKTYFSLESVSPRLEFSFDEGALTLRVMAPDEMLPQSVIDLRQGAPKDIVQGAATSGFLNYAATLSDFSHPSGFVEAGLSVKGVLITSTVSASPEAGVVRGLSSVVIDERKRLERWTIGDAFVTSGELGAGLFVGGISVSKNFELDPYLVRLPTLGYAGSATTPSTLDIYVNGSRVRSEAVKPGPFRVNDVPVTTGSGDVRYVLRDAFGKEHAVESPYTLVATQLAKGQSEYTYSLGMRRERVGQESFDYHAMGALGRHRFGLSNHITLGGRVEAARAFVSGGSTLEVVLPYGAASLSGAASASPGGAGYAGAARYSFSTRRFSTTAMLQYVSNRYSTLSMAAEDPRSTLDARLTTSVTAGTRFGFAANYSLVIGRDTPLKVRLGASMRVTLTKELQLSLAASRSVDVESSKSGEASLSLTYSFGGGVMASAVSRYTTRGLDASAYLNKPVPGATGFGLRAAGTVGANPQGNAMATYQGKHGRYQSTVTVDPAGAHLSLETSGALVGVAGAGIFATVPMQNGFAVVQVPGVKGVRGYLENREVGSTDADGDLLVPNLLPYYGNRLRISDQDLPLDYSIGRTDMRVAPPNRGAVLAVFQAKRMKYYRGRARIQQGDATVTPSYGEISVTADGETQLSPLGKDGQFELPNLTPGLHPAKITHAGGECSFTLDAPDGKETVSELGTVTCVEKTDEGKGR